VGTLPLGQDVILWLALPFGGRYARLQVLAQKFDCRTLIGVALIQAEPEKMHMIWHEAEGRAYQAIARRGVEQNVIPFRVEFRGLTSQLHAPPS
jgi:hypothetical protein